MKDFDKTLMFIIAGLAFICVLSFLVSLPVMVLWNNCLVPAIDGVNTISWIQAWGITFLFSILLKNNSISMERK
jgi:hypothetical protein